MAGGSLRCVLFAGMDKRKTNDKRWFWDGAPLTARGAAGDTFVPSIPDRFGELGPAGRDVPPEP